MAYIGPSSLDMLTTAGIINTDAQAYITGTPSEYLRQCGINSPVNNNAPQLAGQPIADQYNPGKLLQENNSGMPVWKKAGALALGTYLLGFILSKGKKNPLHWREPIGKLFKGVTNLFAKIFKRAPKKP